MLTRRIAFVLFFVFFTTACLHDVQAQTGSYPQGLSFGYGWETGAGAGFSGTQPFWLHANQHGQVDPYSANAMSNFFGFGRYSLNNGLTLTAQADLFVRASQDSQLHFTEGFVQLSYGSFDLWAGRKRERFGLIHPTLSTGSMDLSENARPLPQIVFATRGFMPVPFTRGVLFADASLGHGSQNNFNDRFVEGLVRVHRKHLYLRIFSNDAPLVLYGGLKHFAQWGGSSPLHGSSPVNFRSFIDVFFSRAADSNEIIGGGQLLNSAQNHLGTYDFAFKINTERYVISVSRQFILEDTPNARFGTPWEGLWGASLTFRPPPERRSWRSTRTAPAPVAGQRQQSRLHPGYHSSDDTFRPFLKSIHYEYLDVMSDMFRFPQRARDEYFNYYNHWAYRGGWTYFGNTLGNPLFLTDRDFLGVVNNEIFAHHLGLEGFLGKAFDWRFFATYSRNYGANRVTHRSNLSGREKLLTERRDQWSFMLDMGTNTLLPRTETRLRLAFDRGDVHPNTLGAMVTLRWVSEQ